MKKRQDMTKDESKHSLSMGKVKLTSCVYISVKAVQV